MNFELFHIELNLTQKVITANKTPMKDLDPDNRAIILEWAANMHNDHVIDTMTQRVGPT